MNADTITIETDDHGFELHLIDEDGQHHSWNIQGIAEEVYDTVKREIGPWLQERDLAKASYDRGEGPNGEPRGTWEVGTDEEAIALVMRDAGPFLDWIETERATADLANKVRKENP